MKHLLERWIGAWVRLAESLVMIFSFNLIEPKWWMSYTLKRWIIGKDIK